MTGKPLSFPIIRATPLWLLLLIGAQAMAADPPAPLPAAATPTALEAGMAEANRLHGEALKLAQAGKLAEALALYRQIPPILERIRGPNHPDEARAWTTIGYLYTKAGDLAAAEAPYRKALAIREKAFGLEHSEVAIALSNLATWHEARADYAGAEPLYRRCLAILEKALGPDHGEVAIAQNNLALVLFTRGDLDGAEAMFRRALATRKKLQGPEHAEVALSLSNLGRVLETKGQFAAALALFQEALAIREKAFGPHHLLVARILNNIGALAKTTGDYAQAERMFRRALAIREKAHAGDHPEVAESVNNLATQLESQGDYAGAEPLYRRSLAMWERRLGPWHPDVAANLNNLGNLLEAKGNYADAEACYLRALAIKERAFGKDHADVALSLNNLGRMILTKGDLDSAQPVFERALAIREKALGPEHPETAIAIADLAALHESQGRVAQAETGYRRALGIREKALGPRHHEVAYSLGQLSHLLQARGDYAGAEPLARRALAIQEAALGAQHPDVAASLLDLASVVEARGDLTTARPLHERALAIREATFGAGHPAVAGSLSGLAVLHHVAGHPRDALPLAERAATIRESHLATVLGGGSEAQKLAYVATLARDTDLVVALHADGMPNDPEAARLAAQTVLRRKARALDAMTETLGAIHHSGDPALTAQLARWKDLHGQHATLVLRGPGSLPRPAWQQRIADLQTQARQIEGELSAKSAQFKRSAEPVTLAAVQAALPAKTVLVELLAVRRFDPKAAPRQRLGAARYLAWVIAAAGPPRLVPLASVAELDPLADALRTAIARRRPDDEVAALARKVGAAVLDPLRPALGDASHLVVSPDGALSLIPFAALIGADGKAAVEAFDITYVSSGRDLLRLATRSTPRAPALVFANPAYDDAGDAAPPKPAPVRHRSLSRDLDRGSMAFSPLPGAEAEAKAIAPLLASSQLRVGAAARETELKAVHGPAILHIATHGFFLRDLPESASGQPASRGAAVFGDDPIPLAAPATATAKPVRWENPLLRSGIALAGANQRRSGDDDGILTALEASGLDLWGTRAVVLSACQTGVGESRSGQGVFGLRRALVLAGAETLVMSLWDVDDDATKDLMVAWYKRIRAGEPRGAALRAVQLEMLRGKRGGGQWRHPALWAAFVAIGDWRGL